jgi:hypothetical protein
MFLTCDERLVLNRYGTADDEHVEGQKYFLEDPCTGERLLGGRPFPSLMAAYLSLSVLVEYGRTGMRIVDVLGEEVYSAGCPDDAGHLDRP